MKKRERERAKILQTKFQERRERVCGWKRKACEAFFFRSRGMNEKVISFVEEGMECTKRRAHASALKQKNEGGERGEGGEWGG